MEIARSLSGLTVTLEPTAWWSLLDPHLSVSSARPRAGRRLERIPRVQTIVLVGHRGAGKSTLLPHVAAALGRVAFDLDREIEKSLGGVDLRHFFNGDQVAFRQREAQLFSSLPRGSVIAVGGGFVSHHRALLRDCLAVVVPITERTYRARALADTTRPRLLPSISLNDEVTQIWHQRTQQFADPLFWSLDRFIDAVRAGTRPMRVVTCPADQSPEHFIERARAAGADAVELRSDLTSVAATLSEALPLIVSERATPLPASWVERAWLVDRPLGQPAASLPSLHAAGALTPDQALAAWAHVDPARVAHIKHVEPLGDPSRFPQVLETRARLEARFGTGRVTVLVTGPAALPFRAVLAEKNGLDYLALSPHFLAAPGQRLLADAVRADQSHGAQKRLGIVGTGIEGSMSPRIHRQPFDRIDLPADTPLGPLLDALRPHYDGFAVTSPFKERAALATRASLHSINTIFARDTQWHAANVDIDGARAVLEPYAGRPITILGRGGVALALEAAANALRCPVAFRKHATITDEPLSGLVVWTWPAAVSPPAGLRFENADVVIIAYGASARAIERIIVSRGGRPVRRGARWFIAQARAQRAYWS